MLITTQRAGIGPSIVHKHADALCDAANAALGSHAKVVGHGALSLLYRTLTTLTVPRPMSDQMARPAIPGSIDDAVAEWMPINFRGPGAQRIPWFEPTSDMVATARRLAESAVAESAKEIDAMVADGSIADNGHEARRRLRRAQLMGYTAVSALMPALPPLSLRPDVRAQRQADAANSLALASADVSGWEGCRVAESVLATALKVARNVDPANVYSLSLVTNAIEVRVHHTVERNGCPYVLLVSSEQHQPQSTCTACSVRLAGSCGYRSS